MILLNHTFKNKTFEKSNHKSFKETLLLLCRKSVSLSMWWWTKTERDDKL